MTDLETFLYLAPVIVASLVVHELAHAVVATRFGDPTPREQGRLTLNPVVHLDPLGTAMFAITYFSTGFIFGWARPVLVNARRFRHPQQQMALVAAAGPATNFVLAVLLAAVLVHGPLDPFGETARVLALGYQVNVVLALFNLVPIPPLDGSRIVAAFMNEATYSRWSQLDAYGMVAIFGVIIIFRDEWNELFGSAIDRTTDVIATLVGA